VLDVAAEDGGRLLDVTPEEKHNGAYTRHGQHEIRQPHAFALHSTQGLSFLWGNSGGFYASQVITTYPKVTPFYCSFTLNHLIQNSTFR